MVEVKILREFNPKTLEESINEFLAEKKLDTKYYPKLIGINYQTCQNEHGFVQHSAMIIFQMKLG